MAIDFKRFPISGGDTGQWDTFLDPQVKNTTKTMTLKCYLDSDELKVSAGRIGIYNNSNYGSVLVDTTTTIDTSSITTTSWFLIQCSTSGDNGTITAANISGANNFNTLPSEFTGSYDYSIQGYYQTNTTRLIGLGWNDANGSVRGVVTDLARGREAYHGYVIDTAGSIQVSYDFDSNLTSTSNGGGGTGEAILLSSQTVGSADTYDAVYWGVTRDVVDYCNVNTGWTNSAEMTTSVNTSTVIEGNSLNLTKDAGVAKTATASKEVITQAFSSDKRLSMYFYVTTAVRTALASTGSLKVQYGSTSTAYFEWNFNQSDLEDGWNYLNNMTQANANTTTGSPATATMTYLNLLLETATTTSTWAAGGCVLDYVYLGSGYAWTASGSLLPTPSGVYMGNGTVLLNGYSADFAQLIPNRYYYMKNDGSLTLDESEAYRNTRVMYAISETEAIVNINIDGSDRAFNEADGFQGQYRGYLMGGQLNGTNYRDTIQYIQFSDESTGTLTETLDEGKNAMCNVTSKVSGYTMAGNTSGAQYLKSIEKMVYSTETNALIGATLGNALANACGVSNVSSKGYAMGGRLTSGSLQASIYAQDFSDDSNSVITSSLSETKDQGSGISAPQKGYYVAGQTGTAYNNRIEALTFSNETMANLAATIDNARQDGASVSGPNKGFYSGGFDGSLENKIDDLDYSAETSSQLVATLASARRGHAGVSGADKGYYLGGSTGTTSTSTILEMDYTAETSSQIVNELDDDTAYGSLGNGLQI